MKSRNYIIKLLLFNQINWSLKLGGLMLCILLFIGGSLQAQNKRTLTGTVSDEDNNTLPGVNVIIKGTSQGTVTDINGEYALDVSGENTVIFSFIGYRSKEVQVANQTNLNITLTQDITNLQEVVIVGYGEQKKESLTGAIEQVEAVTFEDRAVTNPALALQGQTPGLTITRTSPRPGNEDIMLQIRGATSVNGGEPLVVIDGVPVIGLREFYQMNPNDIASVSILKDGAASIYGSRAANGVILVTTKRGSGEMKVNYSGNFRVNTIGIRPPAPSMEEYATLWLDAVAEDGTNDYWGWDSKENLERMQRGEEGIYTTPFWGDIFIGNANRFDELFGNSYSHQHNLSVSGESEKSRYRISAGFADNAGALKTAYDGQKQYNIRLNYDYDISDRISFQSGITYQRSVVSGPSTGLDATSGSIDPPFFPAYNPYGQWYANFNIAGNRNATAATTDGGRRDFTEDLTKINLGLTVNILEGLDFKATSSFNKRLGREDEYRLTVQPYTWDGQISPERINPNPLIAARSYDRTYQNYGTYLNYSKTFSEAHNFSAMAGITADIQKDKNLYAERRGIEDQGVYDLNVAPADNMVNGGGSSHWGLYSYVGRLNYDYKGKYLIEAIGRRDGSSQFAEDFRWSNFGSVSLGWILSEEEFLKNVPVLSFLKLRGSYGEMGNKVGIGLYDYVSSISTGSLPFGVSPSLHNTARVSGLTTTTRTWERVKMSNVAMDFTLLDHKLTGSFDYYIKQNDGMLINVIYPDVLGGSAPKTNSGVLETKGWEANLGWKDQIGELSINVGVNMSNSNNELVSMEGADAWRAGKVGVREGYPLNSWFMYETNGFFANQAAVDEYYETYTAEKQGELPNRSDATQALRPGDVIKKDLDGNGFIDDVGDNGDGGDVQFMGDAAPHYVFGINFGAKWRGFDFTAFFQGVLDQNIQRSGYLAHPFVNVWTNQTSAYIGKTWTEGNEDAEYPRLTTNTTRSRFNWQNNDFMLQNNRYMRLKNLVVGYTLPENISRVIKLQKARIYFSGNDLFELTSVKDGYDPEFGESTQTIYPFSRTWSLGLDITF